MSNPSSTPQQPFNSHAAGGDGQAGPVEPVLNMGNGERLPLGYPRKPWMRGKWIHSGLIVGFWVLVALVSMSSLMLTNDDKCVPIQKAALDQLPPYGLWILLTFFLFWLTRRFSLGARKGLRYLPLLLGMVLLAALSMAVFKTVLHNTVHHGALFAHGMLWRQPGGLTPILLDLLVALAILLAGVALDYYRKHRERQLQTAQLQTQATQLQMQLAQAQYQALRMQIHSHFLFNTLNTVSALVERDPDATRQTVAQLSALLRRALESTDEQEIPLSEELRFVESYLSIEKVRFQDRLDVHLYIDPAVQEALVPNLVLQPLVENAIHHGIARSVQKGLIEIKAERRENTLVLTVQDNGPGLPDAHSLHEGIGLSNTRARLRQLYGAACHLTFGNAAQGGFVAEVRLPFSLSSGDGQALLARQTVAVV